MVIAASLSRNRCIMVTNNEISAEERKGFEARGIQQGDPEWEARGIARYVTWPRTVCSIEGYDVNGNPLKGNYITTGDQEMPMADGFKANAAFFKLGFLDKTKVALGMQFKELLSTLWMKAGAIGKCPVIDEDLPDILTNQTDDIVGLIREYIEDLHRTDRYDALADQVLQFKLSAQVFDPFGQTLQENYFNDFTLMSETDLDRQVRNADAKLGKYGFPNIYGSRYYNDENPNAHKIDCVLFAADDACRAKLGEYAKNKLREFSRKHRVAVANRSDVCKKKYREIMADSAVVSEQLFAIPENISIREDPDGIEYENHLLAAPDTGVAKIKLDGWEEDMIEEESKRADFVCWLRNPSRAAWALCLPYDIGGEKKSFYPDFLIVRSDPAVDYVVDILEPHGNQYADNLPKAKALAEYARVEDRLGRIQLIHKTTDAGGTSRFIRLDLTDIAVRDKVLRAFSNDELDHIFETDGIAE